jgi:FkbM family methyltransferase
LASESRTKIAEVTPQIAKVRTLAKILRGFRRLPELLVALRQTPAAYKLVASYLNIGAPRFPLDIPLRDGGTVRVSSRGEAKVYWQIFIHRCYRLWADCETIVDAGANIGMFSVWAARRLPDSRILALEPYPETFAKLQHNLRINQLETRVESVQLALAAQSGERAMPVAAESQTRSLVPADLATDGERVVKVPSITLADLIDRYKLRQIDLLKLDIEGSEWEVLHSTPASVLRSIRRIQFEYHEVHVRFGYSTRALFAYLQSAGYRLTHCHEDEHGTGIAIVEQDLTCPQGIRPLKM